MPHLPQPARTRAVAITRAVRRVNPSSSLPEIQAPDIIKAAVRDAAITSHVEMIAAQNSET